MQLRRLAAIRVEILLLGLFSGAWLLAILAQFRILPLAGAFHLDLYSLYSIAAALGWVSGNVYVSRRRLLAGGGYGKRLFLNYLIGPPSLIYLLRALAPLPAQTAAPLVPVFAFAVYALFFLVPVTLRVERAALRR